MKLIIIDYGSGNLKSVANAFKNSVLENNLNFSVEVTSELNSIKNSDLLVLPGVGSFPDCKEGLQKIKGLIDVLYDAIIIKKKPF
jgi:glutamine amidotransferase